MPSKSKDYIVDMLARAGITVDGSAATDITIKDERVFDRILAYGSLGAGESYMDGWWECKDLSGFFTKLLRSEVDLAVANIGVTAQAILARLVNRQSRRRSKSMANTVYDLSNDFYRALLGPTMAYTCAYWRRANDLDAAQLAKFDLICRKMDLKPGMRILDIGCGWGNFLDYAAERYGICGDGITISAQQQSYARNIVARHKNVHIELTDYRDIIGQYDRIVSIGMFEHVGPKNYRRYFEIARSLLKDDGLFLLHSIGARSTEWTGDPWFNKYIFPDGVMPSMEHVMRSMGRLFVVEDVHNFGADYDRTLMEWYANFVNAWPEFSNKFDAKFFRKWEYYLLTMAGGFRSRRTQLWQFVLSKDGIPGGYQSVR